jgi:hypothetical protein
MTQMVATPESWQAEHFSQANPRGAGQGDVPALLRRVAETLAAYGELQVHDLVLHNTITEDGEDWPSITVYFQRPPVRLVPSDER